MTATNLAGERPTPTAKVQPPPNTKHWFFSEEDYCFRVFTWDGRLWHVPGFSEPQKPEDMVEEWTFYYVKPADASANDGDEPPKSISDQFMLDYFNDKIA